MSHPAKNVTCVTVGRPSSARTWHLGIWPGCSIAGFLAQFWFSLARAIIVLCSLLQNCLKEWRSGSPQGISKFNKETEVDIWILYIQVQFLLHFILSHYAPLFLSILGPLHNSKINRYHNDAVHSGSYEAKHSLAFPILLQQKDMVGSGRLYHMKKFENCCHRTDGFLAFVHPPSSTLGAHWIDDNAPARAGWCRRKRPGSR